MAAVDWSRLRAELAWPLGSHWCWSETILYSVAAVVFLLNGFVIAGFGHPRVFAFPFGVVVSAAGWTCARAVRRHWRDRGRSA